MLDEFVFVGGHVAELLITEPTAVRVRATADVDVICRVASRSEYQALGERLKAVGFREDVTDGAPMCRWVADDDVLDVMPIDAKVLGLKSRWFGHAVESAAPHTLESDVTILIPSAPTFLATKWEALQDEGDDWRLSRHAEDIVKTVVGRSALLNELTDTDPAIVEYLAARANELLASGYIEDVVAAALPDAQQLPEIAVRAKDLFVAMAGRGGLES